MVDKLKVEYWPIGKLISYARNSRLHSDSQVEAIAASIKEFGFVNPCLVDAEGTLIAGHGRVMAMRHLGRDEVPVIRLGHLSETQAKALRIADNQLPMLATWDAEMLRLELSDLKGAGYDMHLLGFDDVQLVSFMANVPTGSDPEQTPEPPKVAVSIPGDMWQMGKHLLLCGDATNAEDVSSLMMDKRPHLMVTDQPYGIEYDASWRNRAKRADGTAIGASAVGKVESDDRADWSAAWDLFGGEVAYVWVSDLKTRESVEALERSGFAMRAQIVWAKDVLVIGQGHYHFQHETCWYAVRKSKTASWSGDRKQSTLWQIPKPSRSETGHSTQKPVECMRRPIVNNSKPGDFIYEPFAGSGTTIIAAEMESRYCLAIEIAPEYVDVAVQRWQDFAKAQATLVGDGRTFAEVAKARKKAPAKTGAPRRKSADA